MDKFGSRNRRDYVTSRLRLRDYNYSTPVYHFVTICCHDRAQLFGYIRDQVMIPKKVGLMVSNTWHDLSDTFRGITIDSFVTMPNHIHVLIGIGIQLDVPEDLTSLVEVVHLYKSLTTFRMIMGVKKLGWPRFDQRLWQSGYHDHIGRIEREFGCSSELHFDQSKPVE